MKSLKNSYLLTKMSLAFLFQDVRVLAVQFLGLISLVLVWGTLGYALYVSGYFSQVEITDDSVTNVITTASVSALILGYFVSMCVHYFTTAYSTSLLLGVIRNTRRSFSESIGLVHHNIYALLQFIAFSVTVGVVLKAVEDRLPWVGAYVVRLIHGAWNLGTVFAVPCIVDGRAQSGIEATKQSVSLLTRSFGENIVVRIGFGVIVGLIVLVWLTVCAILSIVTMVNFTMISAGIAVVGLFGLFIILFLTSVLQSVVVVMLYEYVGNGNETMPMEKELFKQMITPKKAYSVFKNT